ncbi:arsenate reductase ArsC [Biomaibacter acetigenes]|uniref:Arsenate reductase ArsC n=1 Tax=Biomaibacter acetigenes TaxID=2316383 RepID=A0A3G2R8J7_9FIRM|nr:arsenate reductase ArsC [Biomaibacter acetigenes]AYO31719.1 arsenate reductase ArsC [Biomaibacter acetigenes]
MALKVGFICVGNSCRSQMAEGFARKYGKDVIEAFSAGTHPASEIDPNAVAVMKEKGIDLSEQYPKLLKDIPSELDILITMGCNVECTFVPCKIREDWGLDDPVGKKFIHSPLQTLYPTCHR